MPKTVILSADPCRDPHWAGLAAHYTRLCLRTLPLEHAHYGAAKVSGRGPEGAARAMAEERERIERRLAQAGGTAVLLSERGRCPDSAGFLDLLGRWQRESRGPLTFVLGGPHGLHRDLYAPGRPVLGLSPLTMPHEMALVVLLEQLYRSESVRTGKRYHY